MKIGELAKATGVTAKTIRFYENEGLLPQPERTLSGYRKYGSEYTGRLEFIRKAKRLGLSLDEIRDILHFHDRSDPTCKHVRSLLDEKIGQVEGALEDLQGFRSELSRLRDEAGALDDCRPSGGRICGIIERVSFYNEEVALPRTGYRQLGRAARPGFATTPSAFDLDWKA